MDDSEKVLLSEDECIVKLSKKDNQTECALKCNKDTYVVENKRCVSECKNTEVDDLDTVCRPKGLAIAEKMDYYCDVMRKNNVWLVNEPCALQKNLTSQNDDIINVYGLYYDAAQNTYKLLADPDGTVSVSNIIFSIKADIPSYSTVDLLSGYALTNVRFIGTLCTGCSNITIKGSSSYRFRINRDTVGSLQIDTSNFVSKTITLGKDYAMLVQPDIAENKYLDMYDWALRAQVQIQQIAAGKAVLNPVLKKTALVFVDPQNTSVVEYNAEN